jgi:hypothetical protein
MGDPSTIVTETDSQYLKDFVADVKPINQTSSAPTVDTTATTTKADTIAETKEKEVAKTENEEEPETKAEPETSGGPVLTAAFKEGTIFIKGIETRSYRKQNLQKSNEATYQLTSGKLNGKKLQMSGSTIERVAQRYQTIVVVKNSMGTLSLTNLDYTSPWKTLNGSNNTYTISGLEGRLEGAKVTPATIKSAVSRAARNKRMSRANEQKWVNSVKNVRSANQRPATVALRSVMWRIDGRDAKGKSFQKQLRVDIPIQ